MAIRIHYSLLEIAFPGSTESEPTSLERIRVVLSGELIDRSCHRDRL